MKTFTVEQLVKHLKEFGTSKKVYLSSDAEGNSFGTIQIGSIENGEGYIIIYPFNEFVEI